MSVPTRVLGIDPGLTATGYAVVEAGAGRPRARATGVVRTAAGQDHAVRLATLRTELASLVERERPGVAAVERVFFNVNVRTAMAVAQAAGVALVTAVEAGLEVATYTPTEVKLAVTGNGSAPKGQVQAMVARLLGLARPPSPADASDACALALCHLARARLTAAVAAASP